VYSNYQRKKTLQFYDQCNSVSKVIQQLGYPTRKRLYDWIAERDAPPKNKTARRKYNNTPTHPRHLSLELKLDTIYRCFKLGENVQLVSEEIGYSRAFLYSKIVGDMVKWRIIAGGYIVSEWRKHNEVVTLVGYTF